MKRVRLSDSDMTRLPNGSGRLGVELAIRAYSTIDSRTARGDFDARTHGGGVVEVKTTLKRLSSGAPGRFRLWENQHDRLMRESDRRATWYVFVLVDRSAGTAYLTRLEPARVGRVVGARGGWGASGHPKGRQKKIHHAAFLDV